MKNDVFPYRHILLSILIFSIFIFTGCVSSAREMLLPSDLADISDSGDWILVNRNLVANEAVRFDSLPGEGLLRLKNVNFSNGTIELDIKGKDVQGASFVGSAFHGINDSTYDAVYFRPFNFRNPDRGNHSVQYISHPLYTWNKLRAEYPGKYENDITPAPNPSDWFHVRVVVDYPSVTVYVNDSDEPSLSVEQISDRKEGWIGFWAGNYSDGYFRNLKIEYAQDVS